MVLGVGLLGDDYCVLSHSVVSDSLQPHGLQPARLLCPWRFSRQEHWSGLPCPPPADLPNPGIEPRSPALQVDSLMTEPSGKNREMIRSKEWSPHEWNYCPCKRSPSELPSPPPNQVRLQEVYNQKRPPTNNASTLISDFQPPELWIIISVVYKLPSLKFC